MRIDSETHGGCKEEDGRYHSLLSAHRHIQVDTIGTEAGGAVQVRASAV